jgi:NB-ARC domain
VARLRRSAIAGGDRAVAIAGDATGAVIVTGDNATLQVQLGSESGALLGLLPKAERPTKQLRALPLQGAPPPFPERIDRDVEIAAVLDTGDTQSVTLFGESGIGKTYVLRAAANEPGARALHDGVVYLFAKSRPLQDLLQACFEEFWDCEPPYKASDGEIRRHLRERKALVVLDSLELPTDEAQALVGAAPSCRFLLASREQALWDGKALELEGLPDDDALSLFERELGRALTGAERDAATAICRTVRGHPLKILQVAADTRRRSRSLTEVKAEVEAAGGSRRPLLEAATPDEERILRVLALLGGTSIGEETLAELTGLRDAGQLAARLADKHLVHTHSPRYSVDGALADEIAEVWPLDDDVEWVLATSAKWAETHRLDLRLLAQELDALVTLVQRAARQPGLEPLVIRLGQAIDAGLAWSRRFGTWGEVLAIVLAAASAVGDRTAEAWALHESGVREITLGRVLLGRRQLRRAEEIRRGLGDEEGAAVTAHNLAVAGPRLGFLGPLGMLPFAALPFAILALALASGGGAAAWFLTHRHHPQGSPVVVTPSSSSSSSSTTQPTTTLPTTTRTTSTRTRTTKTTSSTTTSTATSTTQPSSSTSSTTAVIFRSSTTPRTTTTTTTRTTSTTTKATVPPSVSIVSPKAENYPNSEKQPIEFRAAAQTPSGKSVPPGNVCWTDDPDGSLGCGNPISHTLSYNGLTPTQHKITVVVGDPSTGLKGSDTVTITVGIIG